MFGRAFAAGRMAWILTLAAMPALGAQESARDKARQSLQEVQRDSRQRFLTIERFARLPIAQQAEQLPRFYEELAPRCITPMLEMILSSHPRNILDTKSGPYDGNTARWAQQLADASATMSAEQVADELADNLWLGVAARARALHVLQKHAAATSGLIADDLKSRETSVVARATTAILSLELREFTDELLALYIANDERSKPARWALVFLSDPAIVKPLLERVKKEPKFLVRCAGLFQGPLAGNPVEPQLLKLLDSSNAEIRYHAAYALMECRDPKLAQPTAGLATEKEARFRTMAARLGSKLPAGSFGAIRKSLLPLLNDRDEAVRFAALSCFSKQKDLAAGPIILKLLRRDRLTDEQQKITVMQSMSALSGNAWNYDMHNWGPDQPGNERAIGRFEAWLRKQALKAATRVTRSKPVERPSA